MINLRPASIEIMYYSLEYRKKEFEYPVDKPRIDTDAEHIILPGRTRFSPY